MPTARQVYRELYNRNRRSPEIYAPFPFFHPLRKLRRRTVRRAWIGTWIPCEVCGEMTRGRDTALNAEDEIVCSVCWFAEIHQAAQESETG